MPLRSSALARAIESRWPTSSHTSAFPAPRSNRDLKDVLGRTIYQEIQRVQVERIKELLATTDLPIKQIARQTGFKYVQHMSRVFTRFAEGDPGEISTGDADVREG